MSNTARKIISLDAILQKKQMEKDDVYQEYLDLYVRMEEKAEKKVLDNAEDIVKNRMAELEEKCMKQEIKLQNCIPFHTIAYLIINTIVITITGVLLVLRYVYGLYLVDPYYLFCGLGIGGTLFVTAFVSLKEWKGFLSKR